MAGWFWLFLVAGTVLPVVLVAPRGAHFIGDLVTDVAVNGDKPRHTREGRC